MVSRSFRAPAPRARVLPRPALRAPRPASPAPRAPRPVSPRSRVPSRAPRPRARAPAPRDRAPALAPAPRPRTPPRRAPPLRARPAPLATRTRDRAPLRSRATRPATARPALLRAAAAACPDGFGALRRSRQACGHSSDAQSARPPLPLGDPSESASSGAARASTRDGRHVEPAFDDRPGGKLCPRRHSDSREEPGQMTLDGLARDRQLPPRSRRWTAVDHAADDLLLAAGERGLGGGVGTGGESSAESGSGSGPSDRVHSWRSAPSSRRNRRPQPARRGHVLGMVEGRQDHDRWRVAAPPGSASSASRSSGRVGGRAEQSAWPPSRSCRPLATVSAVARLQIGVLAEKSGHAVADDRMVVDDADSNRHGASLRPGAGRAIARGPEPPAPPRPAGRECRRRAGRRSRARPRSVGLVGSCSAAPCVLRRELP